MKLRLSLFIFMLCGLSLTGWPLSIYSLKAGVFSEEQEANKTAGDLGGAMSPVFIEKTAGEGSTGWLVLRDISKAKRRPGRIGKPRKAIGQHAHLEVGMGRQNVDAQCFGGN